VIVAMLDAVGTLTRYLWCSSPAWSLLFGFVLVARKRVKVERVFDFYIAADAILSVKRNDGLVRLRDRRSDRAWRKPCSQSCPTRRPLNYYALVRSINASVTT
jgi:hypothetical protein